MDDSKILDEKGHSKKVKDLLREISPSIIMGWGTFIILFILLSLLIIVFVFPYPYSDGESIIMHILIYNFKINI